MMFTERNAIAEGIIMNEWNSDFDVAMPDDMAGHLDNILEKLLAVRSQAVGTRVDLSETSISQILTAARAELLNSPSLLVVDPPVYICGDIHGQYYDLLRVMEFAGHPPAARYLFLGDYVDRGDQSLEVICLLLALRVRYPNSVSLLRGNHESEALNRAYGFHDELGRRQYSSRLARQFSGVFNCLPLAAIVGGKIFCCHGGPSPHLTDLKQLSDIQRPISVPRSGLVTDLLWADPDSRARGWEPNIYRGCSFLFGPDALREFLARFQFDAVCRAHQMTPEGYAFFAGRRLVTVFSAPNYCGDRYNCAGVMCVQPGLLCSFLILKPNEPPRRKKTELADSSTSSDAVWTS